MCGIARLHFSVFLSGFHITLAFPPFISFLAPGPGLRQDEFAMFMLLEFQKKSDAVLRAKHVPIRVPARAVSSPHKGLLANARTGANDRLLTLGQDGTMVRPPIMILCCGCLA